MTDNVAPTHPILNVEIFPTHGEPILLHGWLRAYAEYEDLYHDHDEKFGKGHRGSAIRLDLYEATDGQWLYVETVRSADAMHYHSSTCDVQIFKNRESCRPHFRCGRKYASALMKKAGFAHVLVIGHEVDDE